MDDELLLKIVWRYMDYIKLVLGLVCVCAHVRGLWGGEWVVYRHMSIWTYLRFRG